MRFKTDDFQYVKRISEHVYLICEARYAECKYLVCIGTVDVEDYIKDGLSDVETTINAYYGSISEFKNQYSDVETREQILAEMIFEETPYYETDYALVETEDEDVIEKRLKELMHEYDTIETN